MKKAKVAFGLLFFALLGLIIYQNGDFFFPGRTLKIDLFGKRYPSPDLPVALWFVSFFLLGWLLAYLSSLADRFRAGKENRRLQQTVASQQRDIENMKKDVSAMEAAYKTGAQKAAEQHAEMELPDSEQMTDQDAADTGSYEPPQT